MALGLALRFYSSGLVSPFGMLNVSEKHLETRTPITVTGEHCDELGHLNHVAAVRLLELARDHWYQKAELWGGRPWSAAETLGTLVVNIHFNYRRECFLGEELTVVTFPVVRGTKSYTLGQQILKADDSIAIDGESISVVMDMQQRAVIAVPEVMARYLPPRNP